MISLTRKLPAAVVAAALTCTALAGSNQNFEQIPLQLNAALVVPDELMAGPGYKVDSVATSDGFNNTYVVKTNLGNRRAVSDFQLARTIQEVHALKALDDMSRAGLFGDAMKGGVLSAYEGGKALVTAPVETTKGAVKGVGRWIGNIGSAATSKDPYQENAFSAAVGWAGTRRAFALELGVDPYTDWAPLQEGLTSAARAAFAGGITVGAAMGAVTGDGTFGQIVELTSMTDEMNAMLIDNPPAVLTKLNTAKLEKIGVADAIIQPLMRNYNYTPMEVSLLVEALVQMKGASGREQFVWQAGLAPDRIVARYMQQRAQMMSNYHNTVGKVNIIVVDDLVWTKTAGGALVGVFPIDYLVWTAETSEVAAAGAKAGGKSREIWLEGSASPTARRALTDAGWTVKDRVALLTGDPLQDATAAGAGLGAATTAIGIIAP